MAYTFDKQLIMENAWVAASNAAFRFGGKKSEYFAECLKAQWEFAKSVKARCERQSEPSKVVGQSNERFVAIKDWFVRKNFTSDENYILETTDFTVEVETAKAVLLKFNSDYGVMKIWVPKSCMIAA